MTAPQRWSRRRWVLVLCSYFLGCVVFGVLLAAVDPGPLWIAYLATIGIALTGVAVFGVIGGFGQLSLRRQR
ncbi:hypothetical protein [Umezawaea beigongshangensis]|uniref:hypothetical protein n=1 Tax=Umezawaea beigongshangensis TaxID=2780383 RepID=UPI0018F1B3B5|nr:hypothetical protein [Umezawaea beigongshangensis]